MIAVVALGLAIEKHMCEALDRALSLFFADSYGQRSGYKKMGACQSPTGAKRGQGRAAGALFLVGALGCLGQPQTNALNEIWTSRRISIAHSTPWLS